MFHRRTLPPLPGRDHPILPHPAPHLVKGCDLLLPVEGTHRGVIIGMGCFWGAEKLLWQVPGVVVTAVGYAGGTTPNPTYQEVCTGRTGHAEVVRVIYDAEATDLDRVLSAALTAHDPTQGDRQGADVGTQYRSAIYTIGPDAAADADRAREILARFGAELSAAGFGLITTEVAQLADTPAGEFYLAEDYHQQYLVKNPDGYCPTHATGVACTIPR